MSLTTYEEVRPWARSIKQKVVAGEMPPYRYDRKIGIQNLKYDLRLSEAEIQTIARWVDAARRAAIPADMPPPRHVPRSQQVGVCGPVRPAGSHHPHQAVHAAGAGAGRVVAADRAHGRDQGSLHQGDCRQAVAQGPRRSASRQQRSDGARREGRRVCRDASGSRNTRSARSAKSCRRTPAARFRPTRWSDGTSTTTRPARRSKNDVIEMGVWLYPEGHQAKYKQDLKLYSLLMKGGELEIPPHGTAMTQGFHSFKTPVRIDSFQPHGHFRLVGEDARRSSIPKRASWR